jgi:hypothetical protein
MSSLLYHLTKVPNFYHIETHSFTAATLEVLPLHRLSVSARSLSVFLYGRGTENRTLVNRLKAYYFTTKLYPQR